MNVFLLKTWSKLNTLEVVQSDFILLHEYNSACFNNTLSGKQITVPPSFLIVQVVHGKAVPS